MSQMGWFFPTEWKFIKFRGSSHHQPAVINADLEHHFLIFRGSTRSEWSHLLTGEVKTYLSGKKPICTDQNPSWFLVFSSWNPNFRLFTKSPWTSVHQRKSPISMSANKIFNNHQVLLLTSSFSGYHHWNPHITIFDGKQILSPLKSLWNPINSY
jgi:hypothetical protein